MIARYVRREPTADDQARAALAGAAIAAGAGLATFFVVRLFLARERVETLDEIADRAPRAIRGPDQG